MTAVTTEPRPRRPLVAAVPVAQCVLGVTLLSRPGPIGRALAGDRGPAPPRWVVRVLGGRLLVQGAATLALPGAEAAWASAAVDGAHAASMVLLAAFSGRYRRAALINAAVAAASAATSSRIAKAELGRYR
jgi:hypothetical protein